MSEKVISQTKVFRLKKGVESGDVSKALKGFVGDGKLRGGRGVLGQYWGPQVENPELFVWVVDFESTSQEECFFSSEAVKTITNRFFDLENDDQPDLTTKWWTPPSELTAAMTSAITEVAFYALSTPDDKLSTPEAKKTLEEGTEWIWMAVKKYGKARGAAVGWVENENETILSAVFGYDSLEDHLKWRDHPEWPKAGKVFGELREKGVRALPELRVKGVGEETGYFHVEFLR